MATKNRYSGYKLNLRQVLKDIRTMEKNQKLKREGKLGVLLTLEDVARKHGATREAINYLRKKYVQQIQSEEDDLSGDDLSEREGSPEGVGTGSDVESKDNPEVGEAN
ncbi:MAG: hypothetical protein ACP5NS_04925 [Candidatus Pacearchaeota archaeon]